MPERSQGGELEAVAQPMPGLTLSSTVSYVDAKITSAAGAGTQARAGDPLPLTSKWTGGLAAEYERSLGGGYTGFVGADLSYVGERWNAFQATRGAAKLDSYTLGNVRFGVRKDNWSVWAFVNNVADVHYMTNKAPASNPAYQTVGRPRSFALNAKLAF